MKMETNATSNESTMTSESELLMLSDVLVDMVMDSLDIASAGRLSGVNRYFNQRLNGTNMYWFSQARMILKNHEGTRSENDPPSLRDISTVDWKKVVEFYHKKGESPFVFKGNLAEYIQLLAVNLSGTHVHCSDSTSTEPEIYVPAAGMRLSLPLDPKCLRALIDGQHCEQASIVRGTETVIDLDTCNGWTLELGKDVFIANKEWNAELSSAGFDAEGILHRVQEKLMPHLFRARDILAQPHSMSIYEEGNFFKPHRDTLRGPNHFGTLIIQLPVKGKNQGGEVVLSHEPLSNDKQVVSLTPPSPSEKCKFCAFYTDVLHEVKPITSGYCVALSYHLFAVPLENDGNSARCAAIPSQISSGDTVYTILERILKHTLEEHLINCGGVDHRYVFALDHSYGGRRLRAANLCGRDSIHYRIFQNLGLSSGFEVGLKMISVETFTKPEDPTKYKYLHLVKVCDGYKKDSDYASQNTIWLNQERFLSMEHQFEEYEYWTCEDELATGMKYEHACIEIKDVELDLYEL